MKTLLSIIAILSALVISSTNLTFAEKQLNDAILIPFKDSEIVLVGKIIEAKTIPSENKTQYSIAVEKYLKNQKPFDLITVTGYGISKKIINYDEVKYYNEAVFEKGNRVFLYLDKKDGQYVILPYSFGIDKNLPRGPPDYVDFTSYKTTYYGNDMITISGKIEKGYLYTSTAEYGANATVSIVVYNPNHEKYLSDAIDVKPDGSFDYKFKIKGNSGINGGYENDLLVGTTLTGIAFDYVADPLKQFKSGISAMDVKCSIGYVLTIKSEDGSPACVTTNTATTLLERGWAYAHDNNGKYHRMQTTKSSGIATLQNESQIIIPDGLTLQNSQLNLQPQVIKVILGINNTVKWIKTGDLPSRIQSVYPFSPNWFDGMVYPKNPFYFTFNQTGEYTYHVLGGGGEKQGKIIVTTLEFEQSNLLRPKLLTNGPENIVPTLLAAQDDQLQGPANFTFQQVFPTKKGKITIADAMSDYLPISYTLNKSVIPLIESNAVNFTKEFLNKAGFALDGTEKFEVHNFGFVIYVNVYQINNYKIETQNVSFVFSNDTTIASFGQWNNDISKQKLTLSSNDAKIIAKQFIESEAKTNSYLKKYHVSITPIKVNLEVLDDKLMWTVSAKVTEIINGKQITLPGSMEVMIDIHSGKVFSWKLLAVSYA